MQLAPSSAITIAMTLPDPDMLRPFPASSGFASFLYEIGFRFVRPARVRGDRRDRRHRLARVRFCPPILVRYRDLRAPMNPYFVYRVLSTIDQTSKPHHIPNL